jgi:cell filamentation protein
MGEDFIKSITFTIMSDDTGYTSPIDDNFLGLTTQEEINEAEAEGVVKAEFFITGLETDTKITSSLVKKIHKKTFGHLYDWAGKWRTSTPTVGAYIPPEPKDLPNLMYQFEDELSYKLSTIKSEDDLVDILAYAHHRFVYIHPFTNGNGRTARLLTDLIAILNGYEFIKLYYREGKEREIYIKAIRAADQYDYSPLKDLIKKELKKL